MPTATRPMPARPAMLRAGVTSGRPVRVDAEAGVIYGYVLAQEGRFKDDRGVFDRTALAEIVRLTNLEPKGLKSHFTHGSLSSDGLGKYLGRGRGAWLDRDGPVWKARADLHLSPSSRDTPSGDLGGYVLRLAAEDPDALSSSLVLKADQEEQFDRAGKLMLDEHGEPLPPLWRPVVLRGSDIVDTGAAVDGLLSEQNLSVDDLPDAVQRRGWQALDRMFPGQPDDVIRERVGAYLDRYLSARRLTTGIPVISPAAPKAAPKVSAQSAEMPAGVPVRPNRERAGRILGRLPLTPVR